MQILQLTDLHLFGNAGGNLRGVETDSSLRNVVEHVLAKNADYQAVLVTGDLVQDDATGYLRFKSILGNLQMPVLCIPGNHDLPSVMRRSLQGGPFQYCGSRVIGAWQFIMLDSCVPGYVGGRLAAAELKRLEAALAASAAHTVVCLHHHPIAMGSLWLDAVGLANKEDLWRIIDAHAQVRAVVWGHVHQAFDGERRGVKLFATPSTCAQFLPHSDRYALDVKPPAYRRLKLHDDGRIDSELLWIPPLHARRTAAGGA